MKRFLPVFVAMMCGVLHGQSKEAMGLVDTERAFAAMSVSDGMKKAFLTYLAEDGVIFRPNPVNGKELWAKKKETTATLEWWPTIACVSGAGDMGYTSGPWIYTPEANLDQPPQHGYFCSLWKKQNDGSWKLALDLGSSNEAPPARDSALVILRDPSASLQPTRRPDTKTEKRKLLDVEKQYSRTISASGAYAAYKKFLSGDGRIYRENSFPVAGRDAVLDHFKDSRIHLSSKIQSSGIAASCDMGYTYGKYTASSNNPSEEGFFVRIWKKPPSKPWKLALEVLSPEPKE